MNSAKSESTNSARKIQSDHQPRRFALKLLSRRRLIGESLSQPWPASGGASAALRVLGGRSISVSLTSGLPRFEIDPGVDPCVGQVRDEMHDKADQREDVEIGEDDRIV